MFLLLFSLFSSYDLINCNDDESAIKFNETQLIDQLHNSIIRAKLRAEFFENIPPNTHKERSGLRIGKIEDRSEEFLNYGMTNIWWNDTSWSAQNAPQTSFLPIPEWQVTRPLPFASTTHYQSRRPRPKRYFGYAGDRIPPTLHFTLPRRPKIHDYVSEAPVLSKRDYTPTTVVPERIFEVYQEVPQSPIPLKFPHSSYAPVVLEELSSRVPETIRGLANLTMKNPNYYNYDELPKERTTDTESDLWLNQTSTMTLLVENYTLEAENTLHVSPTTSGHPTPEDQRQEVAIERSILRPAWINNIKFDSNISQYRTLPAPRQGPPPPEPGFTLDPEYPGHPTIMGHTGKFILDDFGLLYLGTSPTIDTPTVVGAGKSTVVGDVFFGVVPKTTTVDPYKAALYAEMDRELIGPMSVFLIHLTDLIVTKKPEDVKEVLRHVETIISKMWEKGTMAWWGDRLPTVALKLSIFISEADIDTVRKYVSVIHTMLKNHRAMLAVDVNSIIDYADMLYEDAEMELLFDVLKEFEEFPNITKSSYDLADDLIENFLMPYRRLYNSERRQRLLDSINLALTQRFPNLRSMMSNEEATIVVAQKYSTQKKLLLGKNVKALRATQTASSKARRTNSKENQRKTLQHHRSDHSETYIRPNRRITIKEKEINSDFNNEKILRQKYTQRIEPSLQLRDMKPITNEQRRFRVVTSADERLRRIRTNLLQTIRPTQPTRRTINYKLAQINNFDGKYRVSKSNHKQSRSTRDQRHTKNYKNFFYQMRKRYTEFESQKKTDRIELRAGLVRKIAERSSYSDEESALKMNLIDALIHGNRTFEIKTLNMTNWKPSVDADEELWLKRNVYKFGMIE